MATKNEDVFIQDLREYFTSIKNQEGDERLRQKFYASRGVMSYDAHASDQDKAAWLAALARLEAELLSQGSPERPSSPPVKLSTALERSGLSGFRSRRVIPGAHAPCPTDGQIAEC